MVDSRYGSLSCLRISLSSSIIMCFISPHRPSMASSSPSGKHPRTIAHYLTHLSHIPDPILSKIFSPISHVRTRNSIALVCKDWYTLERATRSSLCLRGNIRDLHFVPRCFTAVQSLDLSLCSPWGYSLFQSSPACILIGTLIKQAFPNVRFLVIYVRDARDIDMAAYLWPDLESVKLIRWHPRAMEPHEAAGLGMELRFLMQNCKLLKNLDLSEFYCWPEDIPPALMAGPVVANNLRSLNLLKVSSEGFKATEIRAITLACRNLEDLRIICVFHPRFLDYVGDETLLTVARNCPKIRVLHLIDHSSFDDQNDFESEVTPEGLTGLFRSLSLLEDLAIVLSHKLRNAGPALEELSVHCKQLRSLKIGNFCNICSRPPSGLALCSTLTELAIMKSADLTDTALEMIGEGCPRLQKLVLYSCKEISALGLRTCAQHLCSTLVDVEISFCLLLDTASVLWALEPLQSSIQHLHIDCVCSKDILKGMQPNEQLLCGESKISDVSILSNDTPAEELKFANESSMAASGGPDSSGSLFMHLGPSQSQLRISSDLDPGLSLAGASVHPNGTISGSSSMICCTTDAFPDSLCERDVRSAPSDSRHIDSDMANSRSVGSLNTPTGDESSTGEQTVASCSNFEVMPLIDHLNSNKAALSFPSISRSEGLTSNSMPESFSLQEDFHGLDHANQFPEHKENFGIYSNIHATVNLSLKHTGNIEDNGDAAASEIQGAISYVSAKPWSCLSSLSLRIPVGELIELLPGSGLQSCPLLEEVTIKVQGDLRHCPMPKRRSCGISVFSCYPQLSKLVLDCSEAVGFALSAPPGHMDLSLWERWYLMGIESLNISALDYWPPQDKEINWRGITLPSAGLLSQCLNLRKLIIHGTAHEHFMLMLLRIPKLRDVQVRGDYYPAPKDEASTEMRTDSCKRFEAALANRGFPD